MNMFLSFFFFWQETSVHDSLSIKICNSVLADPASPGVRILCRTLNLLHITVTNQSLIRDLQTLANKMIRVSFLIFFLSHQFNFFISLFHSLLSLHLNSSLINIFQKNYNKSVNTCWIVFFCFSTNLVVKFQVLQPADITTVSVLMEY